MNQFSQKIVIRWADLDPNFHVRHSVYYDYGAQLRFAALESTGLTSALMKAEGFGPVIFREECIFRREITMADDVTIHVALTRLKPDASRWSMQHTLVKADGTLCATMNLDGAWIDVRKRKLLEPVHPAILEVMNLFPVTEGIIRE